MQGAWILTFEPFSYEKFGYRKYEKNIDFKTLLNLFCVNS